MKSKNIEKLLKGLMDNLLKSIADKEIVKVLKNESFITGGCIPSMLLDEYINDFDIYLTSKSASEKVLNYYNKNYNEDDGKLLKDNKEFEPKLITDNSINLTDKVQIITRFYGNPDDVVTKFDWEHIKSYYQYPDKLTLNDSIYKLIVEKDLIYTGSEYPLSSLLRTKKFIKRGWNLDNNTTIHIVMDILNIFMESGQMVESGGKNLTESDVMKNGNKNLIESDVMKNGNKNLIESSIMKNRTYKISVAELVSQMNGVDPLVIQDVISRDAGEYLTISEVLQYFEG